MMIAKRLIDEALKLDNKEEHLPAVTKYLEALVYLNKSLLDLSRQRDVRLGKKEFGSQVRLANNCLSRVYEIHELVSQSLLEHETVRGTAAPAPAAGETGPSCSADGGNGRYSTVGPNDRLALAIDYNRRLLSQYDEAVHKKKQRASQIQQQPVPADMDQKLRLERKQIENLYLAKRELSQANGGDDPLAQQTWSPRSKAELSYRIRGRSQSEQRISAWALSPYADGSSSSWLPKYLRLLAMDEDIDAKGYEKFSRLPRLEEYFGHRVAEAMSSQERKQQAAIIEFMYTEQTHVRNLKILQKLFKLPLTEQQILPSNFVFPYLRMTMLDLLFANLDEVVQVHGELNKVFKCLMQKRTPITNFGQIMVQFFDAPFVDRFKTTASKFCRHQQYAIDQLEVRRTRDERFALFLKEVESIPICRGLKLGAMLPMETQRVAKYHLMLERILDYAPRDSEEMQHLQKCYAKSKEMVEFVNTEKRSFESFHKLAELEHRLESGGCPGTDTRFSLQGRTFVHDGPLTLKLGNNAIDLNCLILEGYFVLMVKCPDGYGLRLSSLYEARQSSTYRSFDHSKWNPVVALSSAGLRDDKETRFYLIAGLDGDFQVYHFDAGKDIEKTKWFTLLTEEINKASGTNRRIPPSQSSSSIFNIQRSLGTVEYTSDADFDEFSDDDDTIRQHNGHTGKPPNGSTSYGE